MSDERSADFSRRTVIAMSALGAGAALVSGGEAMAYADAPKTAATASPAGPLGTFLMLGYFRAALLQDVRRHGLAPQRDKLHGMAVRLGGELKQFFVSAGGWRVNAIFSLPSNSANALAYAMISSGDFEGEPTFQHIFAAAEFDHAINSIPSTVSPWRP